MNSVILSLQAILPLFIGLLLALPLFLLLHMLLGNRSLRIKLRRYRLINRGWRPVFLERHTPGGER